MSLRIQIAFRNVWRNKRRTLLSVIMIACGISALVLGRGLSENVVGKLQDGVITLYGTVEIASAKAWAPKAGDALGDRLIADSPELEQKIQSLAGVDYSSGRLSFFALLADGDQSASARGTGFDPVREVKLRQNMRFVSGRNLANVDAFEMVLGEGLARQLGVKVGQSLTILANTVDGSFNAIDCEVVGIFYSGMSELDNSTFFLPIKIAQRTLDTDRVDLMVVQLHDKAGADAAKAQLLSALPAGLSVKTWYEIADYYRQVVQYFNVQNHVSHWLLLLLSLLAIGNVVGTSIAERTGEIGITRALGDSRWHIVSQFLLEGNVLGVLGGISGCVLALILAMVLNALHLPIVPPGTSRPMGLEVDIVPRAFAYSGLLMVLTVLLATLLPALHASRLRVVEALKHNH